jgi:hypothetical protein
MSSAHRSLCLALCACLAASACGASESPPTAQAPLGGAGGAAVALVPYGKSACGVCVQQECAQELGWCNEQPQCKAHLACLLACPIAADGNAEPTCEAACPATAELLALRAHAYVSMCRRYGPGATACPSCGIDTTQGPTCAVLNQKCGAPTSPSVCTACIEAHCCDTNAAFNANLEAKALMTCLQGCPNPGCPKGCVADHPTGVLDVAELNECVAYSCPTECYKPALTACQQCALHACADPTCANTGAASGWLLELCKSGCGADALCQDDCRGLFSDAVPAFEVAYACAQLLCTGKC